MAHIPGQTAPAFFCALAWGLLEGAQLCPTKNILIAQSDIWFDFYNCAMINISVLMILCGWMRGGWPISRKELPPSHKSGQGHLILLANLASSAIIGITPRMSLILQTLRNRQKKWYLDVFHAFSHKLNLNTHNYSKPNSQKNHKLFETHSHYLKPTWKNCMWGKPSFMLKISLLIIFIRP